MDVEHQMASLPGSLTMDRVFPEKYCNVLDRAVLAHRDAHTRLALDEYLKVEEIPFDSVRRMMSVCVESLMTQTLIIMAFGAWLPFSSLAAFLGFTSLPGLCWPIIFATLLCQMTLTQIVKMWLIRKRRL